MISSIWRFQAKKTLATCRVSLATSASAYTDKFKFYDVMLQTPTHPQPIEAALMSKKDLLKLRKETKTSFEGNYSIDNSLTPEERIAKVFGGRIKGDSPTSSSRINRGESRIIAGVEVPDRPPEPDNCCMSGCINCVWELFNEDVKTWNSKRKEAAQKLSKTGGTWPEDFHPPVKYLRQENLPKSMAFEVTEATGSHNEEDENWANVPVTIRVFAEMEQKMKAKRRQQEGI